MFTGIVEAVGRVAAVEDAGEAKRLVIEAPELAAEAQVGDSVAVRGACLTVTLAERGRLHFEAVRETLARTALEQRRLDFYAAMPAGKKPLAAADLTRKCALIVGSEGRGVSEKLRAGAIELRIPVSGVESLNAAMAATVLLYEAHRQRMLPT